MEEVHLIMDHVHMYNRIYSNMCNEQVVLSGCLRHQI